MAADDPGLFDLPDPPPQPPHRVPPRGRRREVWARTVSAEVTIIDAKAVCEAAAPEGASSALDALAWLIWPTDGLGSLMEADAFRVLSVDCAVEADSVDRGKISWTVTVKLKDVQGFRRLAALAQPHEAGLIADSLAVAWQHAADPFVPLRSIPGIAWQPGYVEVQHLPRRRTKSAQAT